VPPFLQSGLFQDATKSAGWYINAGFPSDGNSALLAGVFELPVASFCARQIPAIFFKKV
jgi:hypothetical protein